MSKKITIEMHDILYEALEEKAKKENLTIDVLILFMLAARLREEMDCSSGHCNAGVE